MSRRLLCFLALIAVGCSRGPLPQNSDGGSDASVGDLALADFALVGDLTGPFCRSNQPSVTTIDGVTPHQGAFAARFAWAGYVGGDCSFALAIGLTATDLVSYDQLPRVTFTVRPNKSGVFLGGQMVTFFEDSASEGVSQANGIVDITQVGPPMSAPEGNPVPSFLEGTLKVQEKGWDISGSFHTIPCGVLNQLCI